MLLAVHLSVIQQFAGRIEERERSRPLADQSASRAAPERRILDAGSKTLTADSSGLNDGFGLIREYPQAKIAAFVEEHGFLDLSRSNARPKVGEVVRVIPNNVCVMVNMVDQLIAIRGERIVELPPVAARGKLT